MCECVYGPLQLLEVVAGSHPNQYSSSPVPIAASNTCSWLVRREYVIRSMQVKKDNGFWGKKGEEKKRDHYSPPSPSSCRSPLETYWILDDASLSFFLFFVAL